MLWPRCIDERHLSATQASMCMRSTLPLLQILDLISTCMTRFVLTCYRCLCPWPSYLVLERFITLISKDFGLRKEQAEWLFDSAGKPSYFLVQQAMVGRLAQRVRHPGVPCPNRVCTQTTYFSAKCPNHQDLHCIC